MCAPRPPAKTAAIGAPAPGLPALPLLLLLVAAPTGRAGRRVAPGPRRPPSSGWFRPSSPRVSLSSAQSGRSAGQRREPWSPREKLAAASRGPASGSSSRAPRFTLFVAGEVEEGWRWSLRAVPTADNLRSVTVTFRIALAGTSQVPATQAVAAQTCSLSTEHPREGGDVCALKIKLPERVGFEGTGARKCSVSKVRSFWARHFFPLQFWSCTYMCSLISLQVTKLWTDPWYR